MCVRWCAAIPWVLALGLVLASTAGAADENLVGWWKFDDGAGPLAADSSGNGHDASVLGTPEWGPGTEGKGVALNFKNTRGANAGNFDPTDGSGVFSLAFWCNWDGTGGIQHFLTKSNGWGANTMMFQVEVKGEHSDPARVDRFHLAYQGAPQAVLHVVPANEWAHMAMVFDGTHATGYLNGVDEVGPQPTGIGAPVDGPVWIGVAFNDARVFQGWLDDMRLFSRVLTAAEVTALMSGDVALASSPSPADGAVDVPRDDGILSWSPGEYAASHDLYLGTAFDDVNDASRADPRDVLLSESQSAATYDAGRLEFGQTYYWRVDEVNAAPDSTIFKGNVWSFTVEPMAIPVENIIATSNATSDATAGPARTVDGSGLNDNDEHSIDAPDMWLGSPGGPDPVWIQFEFDRVYRLHEMLVWNYNSAFELVLGFGLKSVMVECSADGADWTSLGDVELAQATALETYAANTTIDLAGVAARYVRLTVN
ncbi:MAG: LamG-like jellyroll fold domain-containing protein, partial [Planctomycetota bacterium]